MPKGILDIAVLKKLIVRKCICLIQPQVAQTHLFMDV